MLLPLTMRARYQTISFIIKAVMGAVVVTLALVNTGLGFVGLGLFVYLHLLLHETRRPIITNPQTGAILCPLDGTISAVRHHNGFSEIDISGDLLASQIIFSPVRGRIDDRLWIDGVHLPLADQDAASLNARLDFAMSASSATDTQNAVSMSIVAGPMSRYIYSPFVEGQVIEYGEAFGFALARSLVIVRVPSLYQIDARVGETCLARQTILASRP